MAYGLHRVGEDLVPECCAVGLWGHVIVQHSSHSQDCLVRFIEGEGVVGRGRMKRVFPRHLLMPLVEASVFGWKWLPPTSPLSSPAQIRVLSHHKVIGLSVTDPDSVRRVGGSRVEDMEPAFVARPSVEGVRTWMRGLKEGALPSWNRGVATLWRGYLSGYATKFQGPTR